MTCQNLWDAAKEDLRGKFLVKQMRKITNNQSNSASKGIGKRRTKPQISRRKEIIKIRAEINEVETKKNRKN